MLSTRRLYSVPPSNVGLDRPNPARIHDFFLGGSFNTPLDRIEAANLLATDPHASDRARAHRTFLILAVKHMLTHGIYQFLDLGSGVPTANPTHAVAGRHPQARVVYVDHDPAVVASGRLILRDRPNATIIDADLRDPSTVVGRAATFIDFHLPIGVLAVGVAHLAENDDPAATLTSYLEALAPASRLALSRYGMLIPARQNNVLVANWPTGLHPLGHGVAILRDWIGPDDARGAEQDLATIALRV